jgi:pyrimidine oxygenase
MPNLELGVFLPIGNNGFMMSETCPQYPPSFAMNKDIAILAEKIGFDFVFSMSKWRGFGGKTKFWDSTLESISLMTGLAAVTRRIGIIATIQPMLFPPPVAAKMIATIDDIAQGRFGINIVTGSSLTEYEPMGLMPPDYEANRYTYAREWLHCLKRLWTEESVTFKGTYFDLDDCRSSPRPVQRPYPDIVCAGISDEGMRFTAQEGTYSFLGGVDIPQICQRSRRMKEIAAEYGRTIKTATTMLPVIAESDEAGKKLWQHFQDGADREALANLAATYGKQNRESARDRVRKMDRDVCFAGRMFAGAPSTIADAIEELAVDGDIDSIQMIFTDYVEGLELFNAEVTPILEKRGLRKAKNLELVGS